MTNSGYGPLEGDHATWNTSESRVPSSHQPPARRSLPEPVKVGPSTLDSSGIVPAVDWRSVVGAMLNHLDEPALLVDARGIVRCVNAAFAHLLRRSVESLEGTPWTHVFGGSVADLVGPMRSGGGPLELLTAPGVAPSLRLHVRATLVGTRSSQAVMLQVDEAIAVGAEPTSPVSRRRYVVSSAHHTRGTLLEVDDASGRAGPVVGGLCYRVLADRAAPCAGCPVFGDLGELPARTVLAPAADPHRYQVVEVRRRGGELLAVETLLLDEEVLSDLIEAKIAWIAERSDLTPREREILVLLYLGRTTRDIASLLGISERTAKYHQANVLEKVGADSRVDLVRLLL